MDIHEDTAIEKVRFELEPNRKEIKDRFKKYGTQDVQQVQFEVRQLEREVGERTKERNNAQEENQMLRKEIKVMKDMQAGPTKKKVKWEVEEKIEDMDPIEPSLIENEPDAEPMIMINSDHRVTKKTTAW